MQKIFFFIAGGTVFIVGLLFGMEVLPIPQTIEQEIAPMHHAPWVQPGYYDDVYASIATSVQPESRPVVSAIVNHHLFAPDLIAKTFASLAVQQPSVIVLISPDHFSRSATPAATSVLSWKTMNGVVRADASRTAELRSVSGLSFDPDALDGEHGIGNITAFLAHYFPGVPFIPLIISEHASVDSIDTLAGTLTATLPHDALFIGSFDFSHMQTLGVQQEHDAISQDVLTRVAATETKALDVDSRNGLRLLLTITKLRGGTTFMETGHSSSAERQKNPTTTENTSYITGYYIKTAE